MIYYTNMITISLNLNNFAGLPILFEVPEIFDNNYGFTAEVIFLRKTSLFLLNET
jgi:hypothetical protein